MIQEKNYIHSIWDDEEDKWPISSLAPGKLRKMRNKKYILRSLIHKLTQI